MSEITGTAEATPAERRELLRGRDRLQWLRRMLEIRAVEERTLQMFRDGHVSGSTHTCQGQEAVAIGIAVAARPGDGVACTYRGHGHALALGATPRSVLGEIAGRVVGTTGGVGGSMHLSSPDVGLLPTFAIIGGGIPVAVGVGLAAQIQGTDDVGIAVFGDGAANIGAFHEGLNLAGVWKVPCVFVIENNLYGEYSPQRLTTPIDDLAERAASYAIPGEVVDGQDVGAVIDSMDRALERARSGGGPTLLEMKTYRYAGHSRSDQGLYRPEGELERWKQRDPIRLLADALVSDGVLADSALEELEAGYSEAIDQIAVEVLDSPMPERGEILANVWA
ncbi:MAG: thiamine pyrophosphate-dependent dehydrogenase E1 component subunit alpha [Acidimicrobiales bacterium]